MMQWILIIILAAIVIPTGIHEIVWATRELRRIRKGKVIVEELEQQLRLSVLYADLLSDLADLGRFQWTPSERQRAIAMIDEAVDAAMIVKQHNNDDDN